MTTVIFGAGASYDSIPARPPLEYPRASLKERLPLANELFLDTELFQKVYSRYPQCHPIIPYLQSKGARTNIEAVLESLQLESETDIQRKRQLAAIRFYLRDLILEFDKLWNQAASGVTNYVTLLDQLRRSTKQDEPVSLVTFNYDQMIEKAAETLGLKFDSLSKYTSDSKFRIFKLHGSVHWGRIVGSPAYNHTAFQNANLAQALIDNADKLVMTDQYTIPQKPQLAKHNGAILLPAIAVPIQTKSTFECPKEHLDTLKQLLPLTTRIIVVGWKAMDKHFLTILKNSINSHLPVCVVAGSHQESQNVFRNFYEAGILVSSQPMNGGFTEFILDRGAETFLRRN